MVQSFWQGKMAVRGDKLILVPFCTPKNPLGLVRYGSRASTVASKSLERPWYSILLVKNSASWMQIL
jgi:hypothetical protein